MTRRTMSSWIAVQRGLVGVTAARRIALVRDDLVSEPQARRIEKIFKLALVVKGVNGAAELIGAVALLLVPGATVQRLVADVLSHDLLGPPDGTLARHFVAGTAEFASGSRTFAVVYLGLHGVVKLDSCVCIPLPRRRPWASSPGPASSRCCAV